MKAAAIILALALAVSLSGCQLGKRGKPRIATPAATIVGTEGQDKPATVETAQTDFDIPANTPVTVLPDGSATFTAAAPIRVSIDTVRASTGGVSAEVANAQIDSDRKEKLAARQMMVGIGLMIAGAIIGFALPAGLRWPIAGVCIAAVGVVLVVLRDPPVWLISILGVSALAIPAGFLLASKNKSENE